MGPTEDNLLNEEGIIKGADFSAGVYTVKDSNGDIIPLTDYVIEGQVREELDRTSTKIADFVITVVALSGTFEPTIPDDVTLLLTQN
ncbi:unnamed protein product [marine sediment metagenome]|uniref:Uncharacterized protein n=1 Tax=marine sediment metagenome TaxID=412755 RepID=X1C022_9ZZZZ